MSTSNLSQREKLLSAVQYYAKLGWKLIPCHGVVNDRCTCGESHSSPKERGKHPQINEWNKLASDNVAQVTEWWTKQPDGNVGVVCQQSGFFVIDVDPRSGGLESWDKFQDEIDFTIPKTNMAYTGMYNYQGKTVRGLHIFLKCSDKEKLVGNLSRLGLKGIDIKHNGYLIIAPSMHFSGVTYDWVDGHAPWDIPMAEAPDELMKLIRNRGSNPSRRTGTSLGVGDWMDELVAGDTEAGEDIKKMMNEGLDEGERAVGVYKIACHVSNEIGVDTELKRQSVENTMIRFNAEKIRPPLELEGQGGLLMHVRRAIEFVAANPKAAFNNPELADWMKRAVSNVGTSPTPVLGVVTPPSDFNADSTLSGTLGGAISQHLSDGRSVIQAAGSSNINIPADPDAIREEDGAKVGMRTLSDTGNGRRIVDNFGGGIRYTSGLGWFTWDGSYWKPDPEGLNMMEIGKRLAPIIASEALKYSDPNEQTNVVKWAAQAKSNSRIKAAIESANSDERVTLGVDAWDKSEYMLGVLNGVIDLRTGQLLQGRPDLFITRRAPVSYTQGLRSPRWEQFLDFITDGDRELHDWLQRAAGYTLTGLRKYDVMFLVYGPGGSGKNTFVESIVKCLGTKEYAWPLDSSILSSDNGQASQSDLYHWAEIRGRRMVWLDELPESGYLKENSVKKLTGSSEISARSPGERPFTFESQAKLWITTNHRPIITDDAMWRRIRPVPLTRVPDRPDPELKEYLFDPEGGLPAVLSWAVEGAVKMLGSSQRDGLGWCRVVSEAASVYRQNEDRIGLFLSEETRESEGLSMSVKSLYGTYRNWTEDRGERPMSQTAFQKKLMERNLDIEGVGSRAVLNGRALLPREVPQSDGIEWGNLTKFARY